jgi:RNA recognition motif-containing protein
VFIKQIPHAVSRRQLQVYLSGFGPLKSLSYPNNLHTRMKKGFAHVEFRTIDAAKNLLAVPNPKVEGLHCLTILPWVDPQIYLSSKDQVNDRRVFVTYNPRITAQEIREHFSTFGPIDMIDFKENAAAMADCKICYVLFCCKEDARRSVEQKLHKIGLKTIKCKLATPFFKLNHSYPPLEADTLSKKHSKRSLCSAENFSAGDHQPTEPQRFTNSNLSSLRQVPLKADPCPFPLKNAQFRGLGSGLSLKTQGSTALQSSDPSPHHSDEFHNFGSSNLTIPGAVQLHNYPKAREHCLKPTNSAYFSAHREEPLLWHNLQLNVRRIASNPV